MGEKTASQPKSPGEKEGKNCSHEGIHLSKSVIRNRAKGMAGSVKFLPYKHEGLSSVSQYCEVLKTALGWRNSSVVKKAQCPCRGRSQIPFSAHTVSVQLQLQGI